MSPSVDPSATQSPLSARKACPLLHPAAWEYRAAHSSRPSHSTEALSTAPEPRARRSGKGLHVQAPGPGSMPVSLNTDEPPESLACETKWAWALSLVFFPLLGVPGPMFLPLCSTRRHQQSSLLRLHQWEMGPPAPGRPGAGREGALSAQLSQTPSSPSTAPRVSCCQHRHWEGQQPPPAAPAPWEESSFALGCPVSWAAGGRGSGPEEYRTSERGAWGNWTGLSRHPCSSSPWPWQI